MTNKKRSKSGLVLRASTITEPISSVQDYIERLGLIHSIGSVREFYEAYGKLESSPDKDLLGRQLRWAWVTISKGFRTSQNAISRSIYPRTELGKAYENYLYFHLEKRKEVTKVISTKGALITELKAYRERPRLILYRPETLEDSLQRLDGQYIRSSLLGYGFEITLKPDLIYLHENRGRVIDFKATNQHLEQNKFAIQVALYLQVLRRMSQSVAPIGFDDSAITNWSGGIIRLSDETLGEESLGKFLDTLIKGPEGLFGYKYLGIEMTEEYLESSLCEMGKILEIISMAEEYFLSSASESSLNDLLRCHVIDDGMIEQHLEFGRREPKPVPNCVTCLVRTCGVQISLRESRKVVSLKSPIKIEYFKSVYSDPEQNQPKFSIEEFLSIKKGRTCESPGGLAKDRVLVENRHAKRTHLVLNNAENSLSLVLSKQIDGEVNQDIPLKDAHVIEELTPLQFVSRNHYALDNERKGLLIVSPTASGKMLAVSLILSEKMKTQPKSTAIFLVPVRSLAEYTRDDLEKLFATDERLCKFSSREVMVRHGSSEKRPLKGCRILVATYDYGIELIEHMGYDRHDDFVENLSFVVCDEIHSRLRPGEKHEDFRDFNGAYELTRLINLSRNIKNGDINIASAAHLVFMSGTLPTTWRNRFIHNENFDVIESFYTVNRIHELGKEDATVTQSESVKKVLALISFDERNSKLSLRSVDESNDLHLRNYFMNRRGCFIAIFGYKGHLLEEIALAIRTKFGDRINLMLYSGKKTVSARDKIERELKRLNDLYEQGEAFNPTILLSTNAIAEGVKFPGRLGIVVRSYCEKTQTYFYPPETQDQQKARFARKYDPVKKEEGAVAFVTVRRSSLDDDDKSRSLLDKKLLKLAYLGQRWSDDPSFVGGQGELCKRFPGIISLETPNMREAISRTKKEGYVHEDGSLSPAGELKLHYEHWKVAGEISSEEDVWLIAFFNIAVLPFLEEMEFRRDFLRANFGFKNLFDSSCRRLAVVLTDGRGEGGLRRGVLDLLCRRLHLNKRSIEETDALTDKILNRFESSLVYDGVNRATVKIMVSFILYGIIHVRLVGDKAGGHLKFLPQHSFFATTHRYLDEMATGRREARKTSAYFKISNFFRLILKTKGETLPASWESAIEKAIVDAFETLKPGFHFSVGDRMKDERILLGDLCESYSKEIIEAFDK